MHLKATFQSIGNLLRVLITLDSIIEQHPRLKDDWNAYKRMITNVHHNPNKFEVDVKKFFRYERHLAELEGKLLDGYIFQVILLLHLSNKETVFNKRNFYF
jgi:WASH complex subunit 7